VSYPEFERGISFHRLDVGGQFKHPTRPRRRDAAKGTRSSRRFDGDESSCLGGWRLVKGALEGSLSGQPQPPPFPAPRAKTPLAPGFPRAATAEAQNKTVEGSQKKTTNAVNDDEDDNSAPSNCNPSRHLLDLHHQSHRPHQNHGEPPTAEETHRHFGSVGRRQGDTLRPALRAQPGHLCAVRLAHDTRPATGRGEWRTLPLCDQGGFSQAEGAGRFRGEVGSKQAPSLRRLLV